MEDHEIVDALLLKLLAIHERAHMDLPIEIRRLKGRIDAPHKHIISDMESRGLITQRIQGMHALTEHGRGIARRLSEGDL